MFSETSDCFAAFGLQDVRIMFCHLVSHMPEDFLCCLNRDSFCGKGGCCDLADVMWGEVKLFDPVGESVFFNVLCNDFFPVFVKFGICPAVLGSIGMEFCEGLVFCPFLGWLLPFGFPLAQLNVIWVFKRDGAVSLVFCSWCDLWVCLWRCSDGVFDPFESSVNGECGGFFVDRGPFDSAELGSPQAQ